MAKETDLDERFAFGPTPIQTAQDALMAFLRKEISEDEFRTACARYGVEPSSLFNRSSLERVDAAYEQTVPDDIYNPVIAPEDNLAARQKAVADKEKVRTAEAKENEKLPPAQELTTSKK